MFRKSRRQLRKSLSRTRSEDISDTPPPVYVPSRPVPLLPPPPTLGTPPSLVTMLGMSGNQGRKEKQLSVDEGSTTKEKIREWIVQQVNILMLVLILNVLFLILTCILNSNCSVIYVLLALLSKLYEVLSTTNSLHINRSHCFWTNGQLLMTMLQKIQHLKLCKLYKIFQFNLTQPTLHV